MVFHEREISTNNLRKVIQNEGTQRGAEDIVTHETLQNQDEALRKAAQQIADTIAIMDKRQIKTKTEL